MDGRPSPLLRERRRQNPAYRPARPPFGALTCSEALTCIDGFDAPTAQTAQRCTGGSPRDSTGPLQSQIARPAGACRRAAGARQAPAPPEGGHFRPGGREHGQAGGRARPVTGIRGLGTTRGHGRRPSSAVRDEGQRGLAPLPLAGRLHHGSDPGPDGNRHLAHPVGAHESQASASIDARRRVQRCDDLREGTCSGAAWTHDRVVFCPEGCEASPMSDKCAIRGCPAHDEP